MGLPNVPYAATTAPQMVFLDQTFAALALATIIPCAATGTNVIALTPVTNAPAVTTYTDKQSFGFVAANASTGNVTINVAGLATVSLFVAGGVTQATTGDIIAGQYYTAVYLSSLNAFVITSAVIPTFVAATKAQVQALASGSAALTPLQVQNIPGVAKVTGVCVTNAIEAGALGVSSLAHTGTGTYLINFTSFANAFVCPILSPTTGNTIVTWNTRRASSVTIETRNSTTGVASDSDFSFEINGQS
jgi:hypothetical protein